jgi:dynein heavy chain
MFYDLLLNRVPKNWQKVSYPSLKPLSSWMKDLKLRINFLKDWLTDGSVMSFWMSSFFFPQGFLTGVLQEFARQPEKEIPIDELIFSFKFTDLTKEKCTFKPSEGIFIHGLILEGASWDFSRRMLTESLKVY